MAKTSPVHNPYYFPERLQAQLAKIPDASLTVVEAPSGFGKTTAVRENLAATLEESAHEKWYTCLGESPAKAWAGICGLFGVLDGAVALDLAELGVPTRETLPDVAALLRQCHCKRDSYLVIDNYQLFENGVQKKLLAAFSACRARKLRIIVITQPLKADAETTFQENPYHAITQKDFFFDNACIAKYCRLAGIAIAPEDIGRIQSMAEGWIAAIRLQLKNYAETGRLADSKATSSLMETAVWNKLSAEEKNFMTGIALLDGFTVRQAAIMGDGSAVPESIGNLLSREFFIRYVADKNVYSMHAILREYLLERFAMQPQSAADAMYRKAASACLEVSDYFQAARFLFKVGDYDAVLSLPLTLQYFYNHKETDFIEFFRQFLDVCPEATLRGYPVLLVLLACQFMRSSMQAAFRKTAGLIQAVIDDPRDLTQGELARVRGEFAILMSFTKFNDIVGMSEYHRKAFAYLKTESDTPRSWVFQGTMPWILGTTSVVAVYWNKSGGLQKALDAMDECLPFYTELSGGHGAGGGPLMRAEACLARGDDGEAETLCHKARHMAREAGQTDNHIRAELVLAQIAILRGDEKAYGAARLNIGHEVSEARQTAMTRLGEICLAHLDMSLEKTDALPEWLCHTAAIRRIFYSLALPHAMALHGRWLLLEKRHAELYGLTDSVMALARNMNYLLPQVCHWLYLAVAKQREGNDAEAAKHLREALSIALPDSVYLPFAEHGETLVPLLERLKGKFDAGRMTECIALCRRWSAGRAAVPRARSDAPPPFGMTAREYETARLTAQGLSNQEIAETLFVSVNTVKTHLKNAYHKTGASSRPALKKLLRQAR